MRPRGKVGERETEREEAEEEERIVYTKGKINYSVQPSYCRCTEPGPVPGDAGDLAEPALPEESLILSGETLWAQTLSPEGWAGRWRQ